MVEQMNLDGRVKELYEKGKSMREIHAILTSEGHDINIYAVRNHINSRISKPKKAVRKAENDQLERLNKVSPDLKLIDAIKEAWGKYEECRDDPSRAREASDWFKNHSELVEKLLKSTGVYERAKADVQKDDDKRVEIYWVIQTICPECQKILDERIEVNSAISERDKQIEEIKDEVVEEVSKPSVAVDGKQDANEPVSVHTEQ